MKATKGSGVCCMLIVILLSSCTLSAQGTGDTPAGAGASKAVTSVVLPADPQPAERHAANELADFLAKMTGRSLPVLAEGAPRPPGRALVVGRTRANLQAHKVDDWPPDTIYIGYGAGDIAIIGQGNQGTLFAAYEFLRDQGCRWYMPISSGQVLPKRQRLNLPNRPKRHTPSFSERGWHPTPASPGVWNAHYYPWAVRQGFNTMSQGPIVKYPDELGHGKHVRKGHTLIVLIPSGDHPRRPAVFADHPEWYPLFNGKRVYEYKDKRPVQACLSNPQVAPEAARHVIEYFRQNPDCSRFSVSHNDEPSYWCECEPCRAMDGPGSTWKANDLYDAYGRRCKSGAGPMSDRYVTFVNRVARIVAREFPDKYVSFFAYGATIAPPRRRNWKLEPNVVVEYAYGDGICLRHALSDRDCQANADFSDWLAGWASRGNQVIVYDYPTAGGNFNVPAGFSRRYKHYVTYTKRIGATGWGGEDQGTWAGSALCHYIKARLMWDVEADVDTLIREFCRDMYGPAAGAMQQFHELFDRRLQEVAGHTIWGSWVRELDQGTVDDLQRILTKAEKLAKTPTAIKHVTMVRVAMNSLTLTRMGADPDMQEDPDLFDRYGLLCGETLKLHRQVDEPLPINMTGQWEDKLKGAYRPPFEAITGTELLALPIVWRFRTDPEDRGVKDGWHTRPDTRAEPWQDIRTDDFWTNQGVKHHGVAWYATRFTVPAGAKGRLWLLFAVLDGQAEVWVDGRSAGKLPGEPWDKAKAVEVTSLVAAGKESQLVIRVVKNIYAAGIPKPVRLMASPAK